MTVTSAFPVIPEKTYTVHFHPEFDTRSLLPPQRIHGEKLAWCQTQVRATRKL